MTPQRLIATPFLACLFALGSLSSAVADDSGTEPLPPPSPVKQMVRGLNPANWSMPKFKMPSMSSILPTKQEKQRVITKKDSLVDEVSKTAKQGWQRTKNTLNPMRLMPAGFRQNNSATPAAKEEGGFFSNLFAPFPKQDDATAPQSVTEWLKQDPVR